MLLASPEVAEDSKCRRLVSSAAFGVNGLVWLHNFLIRCTAMSKMIAKFGKGKLLLLLPL